MLLTFRQRRLTAWLALWLVVVGALLPSLSQAALRLHGPADWIEVCTSTGMAWVQADPDAAEPADQGTGLSCPWCTAPGWGHALPPSPPQATALAPVHFRERPPAYARGAHTDHVWRTAQARAPPAHA